MQQETRAYIDLHLAVMLFGFTAILGDLIGMVALPIVWWRLLITSMSLLVIVNLPRLRREMSPKKIFRFAGIGVIVGLHWLAFYGSIKLSNASITLVCMATASFFTAILEPVIVGRKLMKYELVLGLLMIPGMAFIVTDLSPDMLWGVPVGLAAALLAALFSILNKKYIKDGSVMRITFIELTSAFFFLSILLPFFWQGEGYAFLKPSWLDFIYLLILGLVCTTLAFALALRALHQLSAFASSLTINLEPVYGILLAFVILQDHKEVSVSFYYGVLIILVAVFGYPFLNKKFKRKHEKRR